MNVEDLKVMLIDDRSVDSTEAIVKNTNINYNNIKRLENESTLVELYFRIIKILEDDNDISLIIFNLKNNSDNNILINKVLNASDKIIQNIPKVLISDDEADLYIRVQLDLKAIVTIELLYLILEDENNDSYKMGGLSEICEDYLDLKREFYRIRSGFFAYRSQCITNSRDLMR